VPNMRADHASNRPPKCVSVGVLLMLGRLRNRPNAEPAADRLGRRQLASQHLPGICNAATPSYPQVQTDGGNGNVTMYDTAPSSGGACNYGTTSILYYAAMSVNAQPGDGKGQWQNGRICGQCVEATALTSQGLQSVIVRITDKCPDRYCGIDLGGLAPAAIMLDGFGRYDGTWRFVSCAGHPEVSDGPPSLFVFAGSNAFWSRVQVRNPPSAVDSIAWQDATGTVQGSFPYADDPETRTRCRLRCCSLASPCFRSRCTTRTTARRQCSSLQDSSRPPARPTRWWARSQWTQGQTRSWLRRMMLEHGKTPGQPHAQLDQAGVSFQRLVLASDPDRAVEGQAGRHSPDETSQSREGSGTTTLTLASQFQHWPHRPTLRTLDDETKKPSWLVRAREDGLQIEVTHDRPQTGGQDDRRCGPKPASSCSAGSKAPTSQASPGRSRPCRMPSTRTCLTEKALSVRTKRELSAGGDGLADPRRQSCLPSSTSSHPFATPRFAMAAGTTNQDWLPVRRLACRAELDLHLPGLGDGCVGAIKGR